MAVGERTSGRHHHPRRQTSGESSTRLISASRIQRRALQKTRAMFAALDPRWRATRARTPGVHGRRTCVYRIPTRPDDRHKTKSRSAPSVERFLQGKIEAIKRKEIRSIIVHRGKLSTPEKKCIGLPERRCITDDGKKAPELGAFCLGTRFGWNYPPAGPSWHGVSGAPRRRPHWPRTTPPSR
jgi:hypothetical protein